MKTSFQCTEPIFTAQYALDSLNGWRASVRTHKTRDWGNFCRARVKYWEHYLAKYYPLSKWNGKLLT